METEERMKTLASIARKHLARHSKTQSFETVHRIYVAARAAVGPMRGGDAGGDLARISARSAYSRKVSVEFHRRLRKAGVKVEGMK